MTPRWEWECVGASCRGWMHIREGIPNQDSWLCRNENGIVAVAVSDGMGSCPRARQGAEATCLALTEAAFSTDWLRTPDILLQTSVELRGDMLDGNLFDADSTGMIAIFAEETVFVAQIGDGVIVVLDPSGDPLCLLEDKKDDGFANQVRGFGSSFCGVSWRHRIFSSQKVGGVMMCTDGIDFAFAKDYCRLASDIRKAALQESATDLHKELTAMLDAWPIDGNQDDKTLVFVYGRL